MPAFQANQCAHERTPAPRHASVATSTAMASTRPATAEFMVETNPIVAASASHHACSASDGPTKAGRSPRPGAPVAEAPAVLGSEGFVEVMHPT
jgi:hypothetical protein